MTISLGLINTKVLYGGLAVIASMVMFMPMPTVTQQEAGGVCVGELLRRLPQLNRPESYSISSKVRYPRLSSFPQFELTVTERQQGKMYGRALCEIIITNRAAPVNPRIVWETVSRK